MASAEQAGLRIRTQTQWSQALRRLAGGQVRRHPRMLCRRRSRVIGDLKNGTALGYRAAATSPYYFVASTSGVELADQASANQPSWSKTQARSLYAPTGSSSAAGMTSLFEVCRQRGASSSLCVALPLSPPSDTCAQAQARSWRPATTATSRSAEASPSSRSATSTSRARSFDIARSSNTSATPRSSSPMVIIGA